MDKKSAAQYIRRRVTQIPGDDQAKLLEIAETDLLSLHEENIAVYRLRPQEFEKWVKTWH